jgi:hypothetical protein
MVSKRYEQALMMAIFEIHQAIHHMMAHKLVIIGKYALHPGMNYDRRILRNSDGTMWRPVTITKRGKTVEGYAPVCAKSWIESAIEKMGWHRNFVEKLPGGCAMPGKFPHDSAWAWIPEELSNKTNQQVAQKLLQQCMTYRVWLEVTNALCLFSAEMLLPELARDANDPHGDRPHLHKAVLCAWQKLGALDMVPVRPIPEADTLVSMIEELIDSFLSAGEESHSIQQVQQFH